MLSKNPVAGEGYVVPQCDVAVGTRQWFHTIQRHNADTQRRGAEHTACTKPSADTWNGTAQLVSTMMQRRDASPIMDMTQDFPEAQCTMQGDRCMENAQVLSSSLADSSPPDSSTGPGTELVLYEFSQKGCVQCRHRDTGKRWTCEMLFVDKLSTVPRSRVHVDTRAGVETCTNMECSEGACGTVNSVQGPGS